MNEGVPMTPGELVMVRTGPPGQEMHAVGRAMAPDDIGGQTWWLDLNTGGVHLPQMYRMTEFIGRSLTPSIVERHGFCADCLGFGVPADAPTEVGEQPAEYACATCGGSGRSMVKMTVERSPGETVAHVQIDSAAVAAIECDVCRASLTPS